MFFLLRLFRWRVFNAKSKNSTLIWFWLSIDFINRGLGIFPINNCNFHNVSFQKLLTTIIFAYIYKRDNILKIVLNLFAFYKWLTLLLFLIRLTKQISLKKEEERSDSVCSCAYCAQEQHSWVPQPIFAAHKDVLLRPKNWK